MDVAHFVITAGSSPIPIYSYANRSDSEERPYLEANREEDKPTDKDPVGGATFDDVAQGNEIAELQLALNQKRFTQLKAKFQSMTDVGDVVIRYSNFSQWDPQPQQAGYRLVDGTVNKVGEEISVGAATFPSVTITSSYAESLRDTGPSFGEFADTGERSGQKRFKFTPVAGTYFTADNVSKVFHPRTVKEGYPSGDPLTEHDPLRPNFFNGFLRRSTAGGVADGTVEEWFEDQAFIEAFLEEHRRDGRRLWIWSPADNAYELARAGKYESAARHLPILENS